MKINLGSNSITKNGWINIDILPLSKDFNFIQWDLRQGLPPICKDIVYSYSSHFLEHLLWTDSIKLLKDVYKNTKVGGITRHCIPDFRTLVSKYLARDWKFFEHCLAEAPNRQLLEIINFSLYQRDSNGIAEHMTMFDAEYGIFTLKQAGFSNCREVEFDPSIDHPSRAPYSFFIEGTKL